jgi:DNA invertase Pin-like site-specific DNA recombinase
MNSHRVGYARVSTSAQSLDAQLDALSEAGCARTFVDQLSGSIDERPGLQQLLSYVRPGDVVTVVALDRLGRSLAHIVKTIQEFNEAGIVLVSLREHVDFSTPAGQLVGHIFGALAQYERTLMLERQAAARDAARRRGVSVGRPAVLNPTQAALARRMRSSGESPSSIAAVLNVSRTTIYRYTA